MDIQSIKGLDLTSCSCSHTTPGTSTCSSCVHVPFPILQVSITLVSVNLHSHSLTSWWRCLNDTQFLSILIYWLCEIHCLRMSTGNYTLEWSSSCAIMSTLLRFACAFHNRILVHDVSQVSHTRAQICWKANEKTPIILHVFKF